MLLTGLLNSLSSFAKQLTVKKFLRYKTHVPYCCKIQVHQHAFTLLKSIYGTPAKFSSTSENEWELSPCLYSLFSFCLFFFLFIFLPVPLPLFAFPADTCRQAHTSREPTSEKCNLSISAPQRKDKQCWKNEGINTLPSWCWTNMSRSSPTHKWPCYAQRSQVWKFKDKLDCARGCCCCFSVCLLVVFVSLLLFTPWRIWSFKMTGEGWMLLKGQE